MPDPNEPPPIHFPSPPPPTPGPESEAFIDTMIPTKNGDALLSYYLGLFSILPLFGLFLGGVAVAKGRSGLAKVRQTPRLPGATHARVGIGCGIIGLLFNLLILASIIAALTVR